MNALKGELSKARSLPAVWAAIAVGLAVPTAIAILNSRKPSADLGYQELAFGVVGAIILGVVLASSEYVAEGEESGRQITTSLTVVPSRIRLLVAKIVALTITTAALATTASVLTFLGAGVDVEMSRALGIIVYWVLTALLAFGMTMVARNGIIPLAVLILNSSLVSVTFLLTKLTPLAVYFPDLAGARMFVRKMAVPVELSPVAGGLGDGGVGGGAARHRIRGLHQERRVIKAEILKLNLPAVILAVIGALGVAGLLAFASAGLAPVIYAQAGFIVLGVVAVTSEYQGRQIYTTLTVTPRRIPLYLSKMGAVLIVAVPAAVLVVLVGQVSEGAVYLVLTTLISASVATVVRRTVPALAGLLVCYYIVSPLVRDWTKLPDTIGYAIATAAAVAISTALFRLRDA